MQAYSAQGVQFISLEEADAETALHTMAAGELPPAIAAFLRLWNQGALDPWQALVQSAAILHPDVMKEFTAAPLLEPCHALLARAEQGPLAIGLPRIAIPYTTGAISFR